MSYYGYVERKPEDMQVNWGEISQGILKSVQEWEQGREDLREKLDKETRETQKAIAETPETKSEPVQTWILNTATTASERLAELNRQLKSNQIKPREYNLLRSNIMSDVTGVYAFAKAYDQGYAAKLQRIADGKASYVEKKSAEEMEAFIGTNLRALSPVIDETGTLIYKKPDGASMSYRQIVKNSTIKRDDKNALDEVTKYAQSMKAHEVLQPDGSYKTSASLNEEAKRAIDSYAKQYTVDDNDVADILYDTGRRKGFKIENGKAVVTEEDRKEAEQILLDAAYGTFSMQITPAPKASGGGGGQSAEKPSETEEKAILFGQALRTLNNPADKSVLAQRLGMPKGQYDATNKVLIMYDDKGQKYVRRYNSGVEAMDDLISLSGYSPRYVRQGLAGANSLGGFSWDFSAQQAASSAKPIKSISSSQNIPNWVQQLNAADPTTKNKIYMSKKEVVFKYPNGKHNKSDDWQEINTYINKYNSYNGF